MLFIFQGFSRSLFLSLSPSPPPNFLLGLCVCHPLPCISHWISSKLNTYYGQLNLDNGGPSSCWCYRASRDSKTPGYSSGLVQWVGETRAVVFIALVSAGMADDIMKSVAVSAMTTPSKLSTPTNGTMVSPKAFNKNTALSSAAKEVQTPPSLLSPKLLRPLKFARSPSPSPPPSSLAINVAPQVPADVIMPVSPHSPLAMIGAQRSMHTGITYPVNVWGPISKYGYLDEVPPTWVQRQHFGGKHVQCFLYLHETTQFHIFALVWSFCCSNFFSLSLQNWVFLFWAGFLVFLCWVWMGSLIAYESRSFF